MSLREGMWILVWWLQLSLLLGRMSAAEPNHGQEAASDAFLRDNGTYQNGGYWATPLAWLMVTLGATDWQRAGTVFCEAVEDFQREKDVNEWVNDQAKPDRGVRDYCASASMPLAGLKQLRAMMAQGGHHWPSDLSNRVARAESWLRKESNRILRGSSLPGQGGVRIFTPDASAGYGAFWVRDWSYSIEGCPEAFTREEIRAGYAFLAAAQRADGCMPDRVRPDGKGVFSPGGEESPLSAHGSVDQSPFMVIVCHQYWRLFDDLEPFRKTMEGLEKAMAFTPRNPTNGLVRIHDSRQFRPYSFLDTVPLVGDEQFSSVLYWDACVKLAEMSEAAGRGESAIRWRKEAVRVKQGLASLWDDRLGLFVAASDHWRQPSIWGSLFAVYSGAATPAQAHRIRQYCQDNYQQIVRRGQVRHLPRGMFWGEVPK